MNLSSLCAERAGAGRPNRVGLIGMELSISVLRAVLRGEATGHAREMRGTVAATAKTGLRADKMLEGEGRYTVWGRLMPARADAVPIGLAHGVHMIRDVAEGSVLSFDDVDTARDAAAELYHEAMAERPVWLV